MEPDYINGNLRRAWSDLHLTQKKAGQLRKSHLEELAAFKGEADNTTAAKELKKLMHIEQVRKTARKHGWYLKERKKGMVDHILIPTTQVIDPTTLMVCLLISSFLAWINNTDILQPWIFLLLCWVVSLRIKDTQVVWERVSNPDLLYACILQRNKS